MPRRVMWNMTWRRREWRRVPREGLETQSQPRRETRRTTSGMMPRSPLSGGLSMSPGAIRPGKVAWAREKDRGRICLLSGSPWGRVAVPTKLDLIYVLCLSLIKPEAPRLGKGWCPGLE